MDFERSRYFRIMGSPLTLVVLLVALGVLLVVMM